MVESKWTDLAREHYASNRAAFVDDRNIVLTATHSESMTKPNDVVKRRSLTDESTASRLLNPRCDCAAHPWRTYP